MGWWSAGIDGSSLHAEDTGMRWGDEPADIFDEALSKIDDAFGRRPKPIELIAGLLFSLPEIDRAVVANDDGSYTVVLTVPEQWDADV